MEIRLEKWPLVLNLIDQGIKPNSEKFESALVSAIKEEIAHKVDLNYVSPETFGNVALKVQNFKAKIKPIWTSTKVSRLLYSANTCNI